MSVRNVELSPRPDRTKSRKVSRRTLSRRGLLRGGAAGGLMLGVPALASGCGGSGSGGGGGKTTVKMWTWYGEQREQWPQLVKEFESSHPNIKIQNRVFGDTDSYLQSLQASVSGDKPPDIYAPHVLAIEYGKNGIALDLKDALGADFLKGFFPSTNAEYSDANKQYALGWMAQTFGIFYNPQILEKAGVGGPPETWEDLVSAAAAIRSKTGLIPCSLSNNPGPSGLDFLLPLITQVTDNPQLVLDLDMQRKDASWDSQPVIESLAMVKHLVDEKVFAPGINGVTGEQASSAFYTGKAAMYYSGSWEPQGFLQSAPKAFLDVYQVAETPAWKSGAKHWCANQAGAGLAVANGDNADAAVEFIKWLYEPKRYAKVMNDSHSMPSTIAAAEGITDPFMKKMTSWLVKGNGCPHILFGKGSSDAASNALSAVVEGSATPEKGAADIQSAVKKAQAR